MKNLAICLLLLLGAVGCGDDYVVYETVDTMVCIPKNDFQVLEYDAASGQACVYDLYLYKGGYNDDGITVKLVVDPSVLDVYNVENGLELKVMPDRTVISHYPHWSKIELISVVIVMIISFIILERFYKKDKINKIQMFFVFYLLSIYYMFMDLLFFLDYQVKEYVS